MKNHNNNVVPFPRDRRAVLTGSHHHVTPFDELTAVMVMARDARGELDPSVLAALLAGVGLELPR